MKNKKLLTMVLAAAMVVGSITVPAPMATVKADTVTTSRTNILREDGVVVSQQHGSARSLIDGRHYNSLGYKWMEWKPSRISRFGKT